MERSLYDAKGRLYDLANQVLRRIDPEGLTTHYQYNARGHLSSVAQDGLTASYQYNALGLPIQVQWQNGASESLQYSSQGEAMEHQLLFPGRGNLEAETVERRDGLGRKAELRFVTPAAERRHTYSYDLLGRLTGSTRHYQPNGGQAASLSYQYDGADNRLRRGGEVSQFNPADQRPGPAPNSWQGWFTKNFHFRQASPHPVDYDQHHRPGRTNVP